MIGMNTYRAISPLGVALHGTDVVELDLSAGEERDQLSSGHLEIVPRPYRVLTNRYAAGAAGEVVDLALPAEVEAALLGVHIERVSTPSTQAAKAAKQRK